MSRFVLTSESVSEGHPDKVADFISDSALDACLSQDPTSKVAVETLVKEDLVVLAGEVTTGATGVDYELVNKRHQTMTDILVMAMAMAAVRALPGTDLGRFVFQRTSNSGH